MNVIIVDPSQRVYNGMTQLREFYPWQILRWTAKIADVEQHLNQVNPAVILLVAPDLNTQNQVDIDRWIARGIQVAAFGAGGEYPFDAVIPFPKIELSTEQGILGTLRVLAPGLKRRLLSQVRLKESTKIAQTQKASEFKSSFRNQADIVLIGVSTGGPSALGVVLGALSQNFKLPIVIVQHVPLNFAETMAANLSQRTSKIVEVIQHNTLIQKGKVYIAPGGFHTTLHQQHGEIVARLNEDPPVHSCRPSVDVLFQSAAQNLNCKMVAAVLTGMGDDGARGAAELKKKGVVILAQNEETSIVWGMPKAVVDAGLADQVLSITEFAGKLMTFQGSSL